MRVCLESYHSNPNIGLYGLATDSYCLIARGAPKRLVRRLEETLGVHVFPATIAGTELIGALCIGHGRNLLVPSIAFEKEIAEFRRHKINVSVLETIHTALGNNIAVTNERCLMGLNYSDEEASLVGKGLGLRATKLNLLKLNTIGALLVVNGRTGIVHSGISDKELEMLEKLLKVRLVRATVNQGSPYVRAGLLANRFGVVIGAMSRGAELSELQEGLGVTN